MCPFSERRNSGDSRDAHNSGLRTREHNSINKQASHAGQAKTMVTNNIRSADNSSGTTLEIPESNEQEGISGGRSDAETAKSHSFSAFAEGSSAGGTHSTTAASAAQHRLLHLCDVETSASSIIQQKETLIEKLKEQLAAATSAANVNASAFQTLQLDLVTLQRATDELNDENDELVNDMHNTIEENEDLRDSLEEVGTQCDTWRARCTALRQEKESLEESLEAVRENALDPVKVTDLMNDLREQMKRRLKEEAREKASLERECRRLSMEKEQLEDYLERMARGKNQVEKKLQDVSAVAVELRQEVEKIGAKKQKLERRLRDLSICNSEVFEREEASCSDLLCPQDSNYSLKPQHGQPGKGCNEDVSITTGDDSDTSHATGPKRRSTRRSIKGVFTSWQQQQQQQQYPASGCDATAMRQPSAARAVRLCRVKSDDGSASGTGCGSLRELPHVAFDAVNMSTRRSFSASDLCGCDDDGGGFKAGPALGPERPQSPTARPAKRSSFAAPSSVQGLSFFTSSSAKPQQSLLRKVSSSSNLIAMTSMDGQASNDSPKPKQKSSLRQQPQDPVTERHAPIRGLSMSRQLSWFSTSSSVGTRCASDASAASYLAVERRRSLLRRNSSILSIDISEESGEDDVTLLVEFGLSGLKDIEDMDDDEQSSRVGGDNNY